MLIWTGLIFHIILFTKTVKWEEGSIRTPGNKAVWFWELLMVYVPPLILLTKTSSLLKIAVSVSKVPLNICLDG